MPLSSMNGGYNSRHEQAGNKYWRNDISPDNHGVVTTIGTVGGSPHTSQENLTAQQKSLAGVNVQKSFLVTTNESE